MHQVQALLPGLRIRDNPRPPGVPAEITCPAHLLLLLPPFSPPPTPPTPPPLPPTPLPHFPPLPTPLVTPIM